VLRAVEAAARPGISTAALDRLAERLILEAGAVPSFKGYRGFPATLCTSIDDEIVHGIPSERRVLAEGDLLKVDCGAVLNGWHGDAAVSFSVGQAKDSVAELVAATRAALDAGIAAAQVGGRVTDIGQAIEDVARKHGYQVVRQAFGHGIGRDLHEGPPVPNFGPAGHGPELRPGMVLALEPMLNAGTYEAVMLRDGWTVKTADGRLSAHFEHTVAITEAGPQILTLP
jgi:methionyl aminopeptidase